MKNFYQDYYNNSKHLNFKRNAPGTTVFMVKRDNLYAQGSQRQRKLYADLLRFCKENNLSVPFRRSPKDFREASGQIKAMYTIINKHGLMDKWKSKGETADAEQSET